MCARDPTAARINGEDKRNERRAVVSKKVPEGYAQESSDYMCYACAGKRIYIK